MLLDPLNDRRHDPPILLVMPSHRALCSTLQGLLLLETCASMGRSAVSPPPPPPLPLPSHKRRLINAAISAVMRYRTLPYSTGCARTRSPAGPAPTLASYGY